MRKRNFTATTPPTHWPLISAPCADFQRIADLRQNPDLLGFIRAAFLEESGEALIRKHAGKDRLFTPEGYREYADDLLERMTNPHLQDSVERVGRDPHRKLGWDDRLVGTLRVALQQNVVPRRYALGAAAALATLDPSFLKTDTPARALLAPLWGNEAMETKRRRTSSASSRKPSFG